MYIQERKKIIKGMKTHVAKVAHDDHGSVVSCEIYAVFVWTLDSVTFYQKKQTDYIDYYYIARPGSLDVEGNLFLTAISILIVFAGVVSNSGCC